MIVNTKHGLKYLVLLALQLGSVIAAPTGTLELAVLQLVWVPRAGQLPALTRAALTMTPKLAICK